MKHQYFGDVSDYKKYSVLRAVSNNGQLKTLLCWLLTPNDLRTDGGNSTYLRKPEEWRNFESDIFDFIHETLVVNETKDLNLVEQKSIVPNTTYFWEILTDNKQQREEYFEQAKVLSQEHDIVFLDPDNGIATGSVVKGRKNSSKYVFWDEIQDLWEGNQSLLIYQHFPRVNRMNYINRLFDEIRDKVGAEDMYAIKTSHMVYFLLSKEHHQEHFDDLKERIESRWGSGIEVHRSSSTIRTPEISHKKKRFIK